MIVKTTSNKKAVRQDDFFSETKRIEATNTTDQRGAATNG